MNFANLEINLKGVQFEEISQYRIEGAQEEYTTKRVRIWQLVKLIEVDCIFSKK